MDSVSGVGVIDKGVVILRALAATARSGRPARRDRAAAGDGSPSGGRARAARLGAAGTAGPVLPRVRVDPPGPGGRGPVPACRAGAAQSHVRFATRTGESVQLYVAEGGDAPCVVSLESTHGLRWIVPQGAAPAGPRVRRPGSAGRRDCRECRGARARRCLGQRGGAGPRRPGHRCGQPQRPGRATQSSTGRGDLVARSPRRRGRVTAAVAA